MPGGESSIGRGRRCGAAAFGHGLTHAEHGHMLAWQDDVAGQEEEEAIRQGMAAVPAAHGGR